MCLSQEFVLLYSKQKVMRSIPQLHQSILVILKLVVYLGPRQDILMVRPYMPDHVVSFRLKYLHTLDVGHPAYGMVIQLALAYMATVQAG